MIGVGFSYSDDGSTYNIDVHVFLLLIKSSRFYHLVKGRFIVGRMRDSLIV